MNQFLPPNWRRYCSWKEYYRWAEPLDSIPPEDSSFRNGQTPHEWASSNIRFLPLNEISVTNKSYCFSNQNNIKKKYVRLVINDTDYTFEPEDGEKLFSLLQLAVTNNGQIELGEVMKNDKSNQIHISGNVSGSTIIIGNENEI